MIDDDTWAIRDVVVDTTKWWPGGQVRVHPQYVERIDPAQRKVYVRLTRAAARAQRAADVRDISGTGRWR
jgi:hypothetical protein